MIINQKDKMQNSIYFFSTHKVLKYLYMAYCPICRRYTVNGVCPKYHRVYKDKKISLMANKIEEYKRKKKI